MVVVLIAVKKIREKLNLVDLYIDKHNYDKDQPMYLRKTIIGGLFTIVFVIVASILVFSTSMNYFYNNIRDVQTLIPSTLLEKQLNPLEADVDINVEFINYGGLCVV
jgi:hypothetical protein